MWRPLCDLAGEMLLFSAQISTLDIQQLVASVHALMILLIVSTTSDVAERLGQCPVSRVNVRTS
jgi:hypothetical protein